MNLDEFRNVLYTRGLALAPGSLAATIASVDEPERPTAHAELLVWLELEWRREGAWDAVKHMPPFVISNGVEGDAKTFTELLFPFGPSPWRSDGDRATPGFDRWQRAQAEGISESLRPAAWTAKSKWIERWRQDPGWSEAVRAVAGTFERFVRLRAESGPESWAFSIDQDRRFNARLGRPGCDHVEEIVPCGWRAIGW